jgi:hypothetical protein
MVGTASFTRTGLVKFSDTQQIRTSHPMDKLSGLSVRISAIHPELGIRYRVALNNSNEVFSASDGDYAGTLDRRRKAIGISFSLHGKLSEHYTIKYGVRLHPNGDWLEASDGAWAGLKQGEGSGIRELKCKILPVSDVDQ